MFICSVSSCVSICADVSIFVIVSCGSIYSDVSIFATGHMVWEAIQAGEQLAQHGISAEIINIHTIKPLDEKAILKSVSKTYSKLYLFSKRKRWLWRLQKLIMI